MQYIGKVQSANQIPNGYCMAYLYLDTGIFIRLMKKVDDINLISYCHHHYIFNEDSDYENSIVYADYQASEEIFTDFVSRWTTDIDWYMLTDAEVERNILMEII